MTMPAPSEKELLKFQHYAEAAVEAHLEAFSIDDILKRGDAEIAKQTRVEVAYNVGQAPAGTDLQVPSPDSPGGQSCEYVRRDGVLEVSVVTKRKRVVDGQSASLPGVPGAHAEVLAQVRVAMMRRNLDALSNQMPYHFIPETPRDLGDEHSIDERYHCDVTTIRFEMAIEIHPAAWPTAG